MEKEMIQEMLPETSWEAFDDIVLFRVLGASKHIQMIFEMYKDIARNNDDETAKKIIDEVKKFFITTRGKSSYAVVNALVMQEELLKNENVNSYREKVEKSINSYYEINEKNMNKIIEYSKNYLKNKKTVMLYDYSSSVEKAIIAADHHLEVIIPESRIINGGLPFVKKIKENGHHIHFIPDAGMLTILKTVDAIYIGAETFYPDGTAFNTAGSDILAELAKIYHIPFLVVTPLLKSDLRALKGIYKEDIIRNLDGVINVEWSEDLKKDVDFTTIELAAISPDKISYYITEKGIIKPCDLFGLVYREV